MIFKIDIYKFMDGKIVKIESTEGSASDLKEATQFLNDSGFKILDPPILGIEYYLAEESMGAIVTETKEELVPSVKDMEFKSIKNLKK